MIRRVLFITEKPPSSQPYAESSMRYRCFHPAERLARLGVAAEVTSLDRIAPEEPPDSDLYVFHRPPHTKALRELVARLDHLGRTAIADQDDLSFDVSAVMRGPAGHMTSLAREGALRAASERAAALRLFRHVTVPNLQIARRVRALHPAASVSILRDAPSATATAMARSLLRSPPDRRRPNRIAILGIGDLSTVAKPLADLTGPNQTGERLELLAIGPAPIPPQLQATGRVLSVPNADPYQTLALLRSCGTVIAPLAFPEHGAVQAWRVFLEATLAGCRFIGTATPVLEPCVGFGATLPASPREWAAALAALADGVQRADGAPGTDESREDALLSRLSSRLSADRDLRLLLTAGSKPNHSKPASSGAEPCAC